MIKILYFAALVDMLGSAAGELELPAEVRSVADLVQLLKERGGVWADVFGQRTLRITLNKKFVDLSAPLAAGNEIAFISAWI